MLHNYFNLILLIAIYKTYIFILTVHSYHITHQIQASIYSPDYKKFKF